ncbi:MAG: hypothetical protein NTV92_05980, partial [Candidatus Bipolaricaulota bacterium]|nr:hypothetical protein [Candidatus Bipolaricaulota bacterium]
MAIQDKTRTIPGGIAETQINPYAMMLQQLDMVREETDIPAGIWEILRRPERALEVSIPVTRDDGS